MKVTELHIENYGVFGNLRLALEGPGPHVIFGPNEAGKSTLLQLLREGLFGFASRSHPYAFDHAGRMAVNIRACLRDGRPISFRREKRNKSPVTGQFEDTGETINAERLLELLEHANSELYTHVFGFSLEELMQGEKSLEAARLEEALYGGAMGGIANFQHAQHSLQAEHESLFAPTAKKRPINELLTRIRSLDKELKQAWVEPKDYRQLRDELTQVDADVQQWKTQLERQQQVVARLERLDQAFPDFNRWQQFQEQQAKINIPPGLPIDALARLNTLEANSRPLEQEISDLEAEIHGNQVQLEALERNQPLLAAEAELRELRESFVQIRGFYQDVDKRRSEALALKEQVRQRLHTLNPAWQADQLQHLVCAREQELRFEELQQQHADLLAESRDVDKDIDRWRRGNQQLQDELDALETSPLDLRLAALIRQLDDHRQRVAERERSQARLQRLDGKLQQQARELEATGALPQPWTAEAISRLSLPWESTLAEYRAEFERLEQRKREHSDQQDALLNGQAQFDADLIARVGDQTVADQEMLQQARQARDEQLQRLLHYDLDPDVIQDLPLKERTLGHLAAGESESAFEEVKRADDLADQRYAQAERIASIEELKRQRQALESKLQFHQQQLESVTIESQGWWDRWTELWQPLTDRPLPPAAQAQWCQRLDALRQLATEMLDLMHGIEQSEERESMFLGQLREALGAAELDAAELVERARDQHDRATTQRARQETLQQQLLQGRRELAEAERQAEQLNGRREQWHQDWADWVEPSCFDTDASLSFVAHAIAELKSLQQSFQHALDYQQRASDMQEGISQFESRVQGLVDTHAPTLSEVQSMSAAMQLCDQLDCALAAEQQWNELSRLTQHQQLELQRKQRKLSEYQRLRDELLGAVGESDLERFRQLANDAEQARTLELEIQKLESALAGRRGSQSHQDFMEVLAQTDADQLRSEYANAKRELELLEQQRTEAVTRLGQLQEREKSLSRQQDAARLNLELESARAALRPLIDRYAAAVFARHLLESSLHHFQREHEPQMMSDIRELFEHLTLGEYVSVQRGWNDDQGLWVEDRRGAIKPPAALSRGTREQLYLAIRLAYIQHYCRESEPLPVVMDDVLVNFDQERAAATLKVLAEFSDEIQVLFLTCHRNMLDLFRKTCPNVAHINLLELRRGRSTHPSASAP